MFWTPTHKKTNIHKTRSDLSLVLPRARTSSRLRYSLAQAVPSELALSPFFPAMSAIGLVVCGNSEDLCDIPNAYKRPYVQFCHQLACAAFVDAWELCAKPLRMPCLVAPNTDIAHWLVRVTSESARHTCAGIPIGKGRGVSQIWNGAGRLPDVMSCALRVRPTRCSARWRLHHTPARVGRPDGFCSGSRPGARRRGPRGRGAEDFRDRGAASAEDSATRSVGFTHTGGVRPDACCHLTLLHTFTR